MVVDSNGNWVKAGDVLSFHRSTYYHIALAVDGDSAVHLTGPEEDFNIDGLLGSSSGKTCAYVRCDKIVKIAKTSKFFIENDAWRKSSRTREEVVREALSYVDKCMKYNLVTWNCEHFVNALVTGEASSSQVQTAVTFAAVGTAVGVGIIASAAYLLRGLFTRDEEDKEEEQLA